MYLDQNFGLSLLLIRSTKSIYFFDLSLDLDRTVAQQMAKRKAKSKVKVTQW